MRQVGRKYRRGYRMNLSDAERRARSERMKEMRAHQAARKVQTKPEGKS